MQTLYYSIDKTLPHAPLRLLPLLGERHKTVATRNCSAQCMLVVFSSAPGWRPLVSSFAPAGDATASRTCRPGSESCPSSEYSPPFFDATAFRRPSCRRHVAPSGRVAAHVTPVGSIPVVLSPLSRRSRSTQLLLASCFRILVKPLSSFPLFLP